MCFRFRRGRHLILAAPGRTRETRNAMAAEWCFNGCSMAVQLLVYACSFVFQWSVSVFVRFAFRMLPIMCFCSFVFPLSAATAPALGCTRAQARNAMAVRWPLNAGPSAPSIMKEHRKYITGISMVCVNLLLFLFFCGDLGGDGGCSWSAFMYCRGRRTPG